VVAKRCPGYKSSINRKAMNNETHLLPQLVHHRVAALGFAGVGVGGLRRRLDRLEGNGGRCPECSGPWRPGDPVEYIIDWDDCDASEPLGPCPACGREREIVIDWDDVPETHADGTPVDKSHANPLEGGGS
jgi:hypothetical protein